MIESFFTLGHIHFDFEGHVFIAMLPQDVKVVLHHLINVRKFESQPIGCLFDSWIDLARGLQIQEVQVESQVGWLEQGQILNAIAGNRVLLDGKLVQLLSDNVDLVDSLQVLLLGFPVYLLGESKSWLLGLGQVLDHANCLSFDLVDLLSLGCPLLLAIGHLLDHLAEGYHL